MDMCPDCLSFFVQFPCCRESFYPDCGMTVSDFESMNEEGHDA